MLGGSTQVYRLETADGALDWAELNSYQPQTASINNREVILKRFGTAAEALFAQKRRIEEDVDGYRVARDKLLGDLKDSKESSRTRAGRKFEEISAQLDLCVGVSDKSTVVDLCGAPGAFSVVLRKKFPTVTIVGFSLKAGIPWFEDLASEARNFRVFWGCDGDGDMYSVANWDSLVEEISDHSCSLVVADGGFDEFSDLQELVLSRLVFSECAACLACLDEHGNFLCKIFDCFSDLTHSILYLLARAFREISIVKPASSRTVNSERYVVCRGLLDRKIVDPISDHFRRVASLFTPTEAPVSLVPSSLLTGDRKFLETLEVATLDLSVRQTAALRRVLDERDRRKRRRLR